MDWKTLREDRGMTQAVLADAAGISVKTVVRLERGDRVSGESLMAVRAVLGEGMPPAAATEGSTAGRVEETRSGAGTSPGAATEGRPRPFRWSALANDGIRILVLLASLSVPYVLVTSAITWAALSWAPVRNVVFPSGIDPADRPVVVEAMASIGEAVAVTNVRSALVRADRLSRLDPLPRSFATLRHAADGSPAQILPWPESLLADVPAEALGWVRQTPQGMKGLMTDAERRSPVPDLPFPVGYQQRISRHLAIWNSHSRYGIVYGIRHGSAVPPSPMTPSAVDASHVVVLAGPLPARACRDAIALNANLAPGRMLVSAIPSGRQDGPPSPDAALSVRVGEERPVPPSALAPSDPCRAELQLLRFRIFPSAASAQAWSTAR